MSSRGFIFKPYAESGTPTQLSQYRAMETDIRSIPKFNQPVWCLQMHPSTSILHINLDLMWESAPSH